jgi:hypothetical protein
MRSGCSPRICKRGSRGHEGACFVVKLQMKQRRTARPAQLLRKDHEDDGSLGFWRGGAVSPMHRSRMEGGGRELVAPSVGETWSRACPGVYCLVIFVSASAGDNTTAAHSSTIPTAPLLRAFSASCTIDTLLAKFHRFLFSQHVVRRPNTHHCGATGG